MLWPQVNGWGTADHCSLTNVTAGGSPERRRLGVIGVFREYFPWVVQREDIVAVPGAGPLKITSGPLGAGAETWAQRTGKLHFTGKLGVSGVFHLKDDTVTLDPP